jgi:hypothetical protein
MNIHKKNVHKWVKTAKMRGGIGLQAGGMDWVIQGRGDGKTVLHNVKEWGKVLIVWGQP